uniref:Predicted protein n=1 Tax=Hordeum vulgare subsp. vulgare TaxID=112509 RepID=F2DEF5_HORVV|nr:predicted protein [Hordeum vulgare subsp. vulgare]
MFSFCFKTWIVLEQEKVPLLYTWSPGMLIFLSSLISGRTMARRRTVRGIFSLLSGFLVYSCKEYKIMRIGPCFVLMKLWGWLIVGVGSLRNCTRNMRKQAKQKKVIPAQTLWFDILKSQIETGTPYMLYLIVMGSRLLKAWGH